MLRRVEEADDAHRVLEPLLEQRPQPFRTVSERDAGVLRRRAQRRQFAQQPPRHRRVALAIVPRALHRREVPHGVRPHPTLAVRLGHPQRPASSPSLLPSLLVSSTVPVAIAGPP